MRKVLINPWIWVYTEFSDKAICFPKPCCPPGEDMPYHKLAVRYRALRDAT